MENPKRLSLQSADGVQLNLDALYQIAPSCFTEAADSPNGGVKRVVNFDILRQLLGDDAVEDATEAYEFNWVGKQAARAEVLRPINKTLRPVKEDSVDWDTTQNLYIEGDNLEVLKLLQKSYLGKVKMIYIDPPYNTRNDFVYHDYFARSQAEEDLFAGNVDELGNRFIKNTGYNGRFHSDWCSMIYSRLMVARSLLAKDGVIFMSIDDNEVENLKKISNEVFGENNFVGQWNWFKSATPPALSKKIKKNIEYILAYQKGGNNDVFTGLKKTSSSNDPITKPQNTYKDLLFPAGSISTKLADGVYPKGIYGTEKFPNELLNDLIVKNGKNENDVTFRNRFIWVQTTLDEQLSNGTRIELSKQLVISYKKAEYNREVPPSLIDIQVGVDTTENAGRYITDIFDGKKIFDYPKPVSLLHYLTNFFIEGDKGSTILDFFSGSATTAHSVIQLNAEDGGNRKFIMVQLPEKTEEDSEAYKAGYKNICEIGKERIRRAGKKIKEEHPEAQDLDTGFRVFRVDESNFEDVERTPKLYNQEQLELFLNNIKSDRTDLDLLFGCMLNWGVQLSLPMTTEEVDGKNIYTVNEGDLVACFADKVTDNVVRAMAEKQPLRVIFRDSCFERDADKINIYETFKQLMDWSDQEVVKNIRVI
ncbi:MAG: site-specific DNA-methyltransferase [Alloprevotella sp.]|nr:site-specific DNA-methyltransferase [Alloprevotella sp.]